MTGADADEPDGERDAVTGTPIGSSEGRREAITGDDTSGQETAIPYPADGVSPDRGSSAPRD